ncbi:hypothetical protein AB0912_03015 [Streptomyces sp. NPDC007084]|uniref:hypothetical protein n=1 Tax=Streptomyces sp. NPDC007084 TaxID=3154313 RepID=UPI00345245EE
MTQARAIIIGAVIAAVAAIVAALLTGLLGGSSKTNACKNDRQTVQNCGESNQINIGPSAATPSPSAPTEGNSATGN